MPRPRKNSQKRQQQNYSLNPVVIKALADQADRAGISASELLETFLKQCLNLADHELNMDADTMMFKQSYQQNETQEVTEADLDQMWSNLIEQVNEAIKTQKRIISEGIKPARLIKPLPKKRPEDWDFNDEQDYLRFTK